MKRILALVLILTMLLCFTGCNKAVPAETSAPAAEQTTPTAATETIAPTTEPVTEPVIIKPEIMNVSFNYETEDLTAENDIVLMRHTIPYLNLYQVNNSKTSVIIRDFQSFTDHEEEINDLMATATENYSPDTSWYPYELREQYHVARLDNQILSLNGMVEVDSHGDHPVHNLVSLTYDMNTGNRLHFADLIATKDSAENLAELVLNSLSEMGESVMLFDDYVSVVMDHFNTDKPISDSWYLTDTGLVVYFSVYEISTYASGDFIFEYPYAELTSILKEEFIPNARESYEGELTVKMADTAAVNESNVICQLYLSHDGPKVMISADGVVSDVRIEKGYWNADGSMFYVTDALFASNYLHEDGRILIQTLLQGKPTIRISYKTVNGEISKYLSFNDETKEVELTYSIN